jgi:hypothetical protein
VTFFFIAINVSLNVLIVHIIWLFYRQVCFIIKEGQTTHKKKRQNEKDKQGLKKT